MKQQIEAIVSEYAQRPGPLLLVLHAIQNALGYVPEDAVAVIAHELNLSRAEVHGVISFYHHFRRSPPGQHVVQICRAEACQSMQGAQLAAHAQAKLQIDFHQSTADGRFSLQPVYCLGNCACAPAMMLDGKLIGRVSKERFDAAIAACEDNT